VCRDVHAARDATVPEDAVKRSRPSRDQATRSRLVDVATRQFAAVGYRDATIRTICREARANVAAVNYHFRDKAGLYRDVLESAFGVVHQTTERAIAEGKGRSPEDKLRAYIRVQCEAILAASGPNVLQQLMDREAQEPTPGLEDVLERTFKPRFEYLFGIVGELLTLPPSDVRVRLTAFSIHGSIVLFRQNPVSGRLRAPWHIAFSPAQITEHLLTYSLAAIEGYRPWRARHRLPRT
jgi:AcrR family transcriptional regulator